MQRKERNFNFDFPDCDKLPPPVLPFTGVSFSYNGKKEDYLYENLNLGIDCDSRVALVGPNGAGKSTLLKLMVGDLTPSEGTVTRHAHLSIGRYYQHSADLLDDNASVLEFFQRTYPNTATFVRDEEQWRSFLGRYGVSGKMQATKIGQLSDGQKSRIVIATICMSNPNLLLLDEPTNHLVRAASRGSPVARADARAAPVLRDRTWRPSMAWRAPSTRTRAAWSSSATTSASSTPWPRRFGCATRRRSPCGRATFVHVRALQCASPKPPATACQELTSDCAAPGWLCADKKMLAKGMGGAL